MIYNENLITKKKEKVTKGNFLSSNKNKIINVNKSIKNKVKNTKLNRITKINNYFIQLPKIIMINSLITKKTIIKNDIIIFKNKKISICYFSKKCISQSIIKLPKINICYININRIYYLENNNKILSNYNYNDNIIINNSDNEEQKINIKENKIVFKKDNNSIIYKVNILSRKLTDIFSEKSQKTKNINLIIII